MKQSIRNIYQLGIKELLSLWRDPVMVIFIIYAFSLSIYVEATAMPETLNKAPIAVVDEDKSQLSKHIVDALIPPHFLPPHFITLNQLDERMDKGLDTFALIIPINFQSDLLAGKAPEIQLSVDATRMSQAFTGSGYLQAIVQQQVTEFLKGANVKHVATAELVLRAKFNPELNNLWFGSVMQLINNITMLAIVLTGAALIREREHGTLEHLLVMPVTPFEIMSAKILAMLVVVLLATVFALTVVIRGFMEVPTQGAMSLFFLGTGLHLFAASSLGIFLATLARSMPQFGMLLLLVLLPLQLLSGGLTPRESMPELVQLLMLAAPDTHFVRLSQSVLYRGAGWEVVWPELLSLAVIGALLFMFSLRRFRQSLTRIN